MRLVPAAAALLVVAGCAPDPGCGGHASGAHRPVARIEDASLRAGYGTLVTLDGARSSDADGDPLTYRWRIVTPADLEVPSKRVDAVRFTFRTAPARRHFPLRPSFGPVAIPRGGEGDVEVELVVSDGAHEDTARARVRSAAPTGGWPRVETGLDLTVTCGGAEDSPAEWALTARPATSRAVVLEPTRCLARVRADLAGKYVLEERNSGRRIPFWYGDWTGEQQCSRPECHPREGETWRSTKHATVFARGMDGALGPDYGPACWGCHTLGTGTGGRSPGFGRAAEEAHWRGPAAPAPGTYAAMPPSVKRWANVQCEQCHGPGRFWTGLSANVCAQCHDAPPRYHLVADWRRNRMSVPPSGARATLPECASCHTAHGGITRLDGAAAVVPREEPDAQGITCPVCHDPHETRFAGQLRRFGDVTVGDRVVQAGKSAVCFACHGAFAAPSPAAAALGDTTPHAPQGWMLVTAAGDRPAPHAAVPDLCVGCHMAEPTVAPRGPIGPPSARPQAAPHFARAGEASRDARGGHTFLLRGGGETLDAACRGCHADVHLLEVGGGLATRRLAEDTELLRSRVRAAAALLEARGCDGSAPVDLVLSDAALVLVDALGRPMQDCAHAALLATAPLHRAAALLALVDQDGSAGAHNLPLASALVARGLAVLRAP